MVGNLPRVRERDVEEVKTSTLSDFIIGHRVHTLDTPRSLLVLSNLSLDEERVTLGGRSDPRLV